MGCARDPALVYVDLNKVAAASLQPVDAPRTDKQPEIGSTESIPQLDERDLFIGSAEERATAALELYQKTQEQAAKAVLDRLQKAYTAEAEREAGTETEQARQQYQDGVQKEIDAMHALFEKHAKDVGQLRYDLTAVVGFPDPDPRSLRVPRETDVEATKRFNKAKALRTQIKDLDDAFREEVKTRTATLSEGYNKRLNQIGLEASEARKQALERAKKDADALAQNALALLERTALDPSAKLTAVPGAESSVNSGPEQRKPLAKSTGAKEPRDEIKAQLEVFLKVYRYRLAKRPSEGRDVTQEFLQWRRIYMVGR